MCESPDQTKVGVTDTENFSRKPSLITVIIQIYNFVSNLSNCPGNNLELCVMNNDVFLEELEKFKIQ